jgi:hypothetical protein
MHVVGQHESCLRARGTLQCMRLLVILALGVIGVAVVMKAAGYDLPLLDYPIGPFGETLTRPQIEVRPPGYDVPLP